MKITIYPYSGSQNHGCEALERGIARELKGNNLYLYSKNPNEDYQYNLDDIYMIDSMHVDVFENAELFNNIKKYCEYSVLDWNELEFYNVLHSNCDIAVCIGGDEYCYPSQPPKLAYINSYFKKRNIPTFLWGCSIEPNLIEDKEILEDLKNYTYITARESITYTALKKAGLKNVGFSADPAFLLEKQTISVPSNFLPGNTVV